MKKVQVILVAVVFVVFQGTHVLAGSVQSVTVDTTNALTTVTVERGKDFTYEAASLTRIDLTDIQGRTSDDLARIIGSQDDTTAPPAGQRATFVENLRFDEGLNNPSGWAIDFLQPLSNSVGADVILFDFGAADDITVTVNGQSINYSASHFTEDLIPSETIKIYQSNTAVTNLSTFENAGTTYPYLIATASKASALAIDLSHFGVAYGATITSMSFSDPASSIDPLIITGLPGEDGLIDDFETFDVGDNINGVNGWTTAPGNQTITNALGDAYDRMLQISGPNENIYKTVNVPDNSIGELFFRFHVVSGTPDLGICLTANAAPSSGTQGSSVLRIVGGSLQAYDGGWKTLTGYASGKTYKVKQIIDTKTDTWQVQIKGGLFSDWTLLNAAGDDTFAFRDGVGANDLVNFYIRTNGSHNGDTLIDDVMVSSVPHPVVGTVVTIK